MNILSNRFQLIARSITGKVFSRRQFIATSSYSIVGTGAFLSALSACSRSSEEEEQEAVVEEPEQEAEDQAPEPEQPPSKITRIKMGTMAAADLQPVEDRFKQWLGYSVVERGQISEALSTSWGTPDMTGRDYVLMQPEGGDDVFIRAVQIDDVAGFRGMTTFGWNCFEIVTGDLYKVSDTLQDSPWEIIGGPASLGGNFASIHAMQMIGPSQEVLYLTEQTDKEATLLPDPRGLVGRTFILVLGGPDVGAIMNFYGSKFSIPVGEPNEGTNALVNKALDLPDDYKLEIGFMPLGEPGNFLEIDGYPEMAGARPRTQGQLPPGNALCSFSVNDLDDLDLDYISAPVRDDSLAYGGHRSATFVGPAGEFTELIEEPREPVAT
jgi:hypothetical protein